MPSDDDRPHDPLTDSRRGLVAARLLASSLLDRTPALEVALNNGDGEATHPALASLYDEIASIAGDMIELHLAIEVEFERQLRDL